MTDIINLNSIRSDNCDCNKPKPKENSCGCHNHKPQPCYLAVDLSDLYFKVKNLFGELKSEWQRAEARSNLGIIDILKLELTKESLESGGTNEWTMTTLKGGVTSIYKFYVKNGLKGETGPLGKSAYDIYCETTTDYPVKTLALWLGSLKGDQGEVGPAGKSAYDIYCEYTTDYPVKTEPQWLASLKGEPGDKGDPGDGGGEEYKIDKFSLIGKTTGTPSPNISNADPFTGDYLTWLIQLKNGEVFPFWVPYSVATGGGNNDHEGEGDQNYRYNVFLFKLKEFTEPPTDSEIAGVLLDYSTEVLNKSVDTLLHLSYDPWFETAPRITKPGLQFIFMATCVVTNGTCGVWSVICLTGSKGQNGTNGDGTLGKDGQFTSVVFTRTNLDISGQKPLGGSYTEPYPRNMNYQNLTIIWEDGIPEEKPDGEPNQLWASSSVFKSGDTAGDWTYPTRMTDTTTYDVEFALELTNDDTPVPPSNLDNALGNRHYSVGTQIWYDPKLDRGRVDFTRMYWRAERECHNGVWDDWVITRIKGEKGADGTGSGSQGEKGDQGLMGPIIRMFIYDPEQPGTCYYNQTNVNPTDPLQLRYIDVVYYDDPNNSEPGKYYMPKATTNGDCVYFSSTSNDWEEAQGFSFAYILTLITNLLSSYTIDTSEIRIHSNPDDANNDFIVAGMTSGKSFANTPVLNINNDEDETDPIRIWAGNPTSVSAESMDLMDAPFRVTENGVLFASNADIEGTIQANILRLGKDSFSVCETGENTIGRSLTGNTLTLPRLIGRKVQMFYLLTDAVNNNITVNTANSNDKLISFNSTTQSMNSPTTSIEVLPKRLYLFFGIDHEWRICEVTLAPVTAVATTTDGGIVDPSYYQANCIWSIEDYLIDVPNDTHKRLGIRGTMSLVVTNNYTSDITLHIADIPLNVSWTDTQNYQATYDIKLTTNGIVAPVGKTVSTSLTYDRENNPPVFNGNGFEVSLENFNNLGGLTDAIYNSGPTVSIVSENLGGFNTNTFLSFVGDALLHIYLYKFLLPLISATYHRAPGETMLNASNPNGNNNSNSGENIEESGDDGVITEVTDFYHYFKPALTVWSNKKVGFAYDSSGEFRDYDAKMYNSTRNYPIQVTFPASASIYFYIAGTVSGVEKVMYGGELMLSFHDSVSNSEVNLDNLLIKPNTNKIDYEFGFYDTPGESDDPASIHFRRYFSQSYVDGPGTAAQRFYGAFIFMWPKGKIKNYDNPYIYGYSVVKHNVETTKTDFEATYTDIEPEQVSLPQIKAYKYVPRSTFSNLITLTQQNN